MKKSIREDHITFGVCYYPEHWDSTLHREDLRRMKAAGISRIRIAEFAWNYFEPREGEFTFEFFDAFLEIAREEGMEVIFCTPTATPPAWMSHRYPEILNADLDGHLIRHGHRRHCNLNSERYRFFSARITEQLARHYGKHPSIVMWQLDNEINCECDTYHSESDHGAFRLWLKARFGTLDALNAAIGATFWNQTYTDWEEVCLPRRTNGGAHGNPHMELLEKHFISDTVIGYFRLQAEILRRYTDCPITTNGLFRYVDYHRLTDEVLDFITYDSYPNFAYNRKSDPRKGNGLRDRNSSYKLMRTRGISPCFGVMEQQAGPGGWTFRHGQQRTPKPGQIRLWTLQSIAHGADYVGYFRWRTCGYGTEIYWHGILNYDNRDTRRLREISDTAREIEKLQGVCGHDYEAEIAVLRDYDNEWDTAVDEWHAEFDQKSNDGWFVACQKAHVPYDLVYICDKTPLSLLEKYKTVIYPHAVILTEPRAQLLRAYMEAGGTVIFGCRTDYKDLTGRCPMMPMPGHAAALTGAEVADFTVRLSEEEEQTVRLADRVISAPCFNDILEVTDGEVIGVYESDYYKGKPAVTLKRIGRGRAYYFGAVFTEDVARAFLELTGIATPLSDVLTVPESVELAVRGDGVFLLNYDSFAKEIPTKRRCSDLLTGTEFTDCVILPPYGAVVLGKSELIGENE